MLAATLLTVSLVVLQGPPDSILTGFQHPDSNARKQALGKAMGLVRSTTDRPERYLPHLARLALAEDEHESFLAGYILGHYGEPGVALLLPLVDGKPPIPCGPIEGLTVATMCRIRVKGMVLAFLKGLDPEQSDRVRKQAMAGLVDYRPAIEELPPGALATLRACLGDKRWSVRSGTQAMFQFMGADAYPHLLETIANDSRAAQLRALEVVRILMRQFRMPNRATAILEKAAESRDVEVSHLAQLILDLRP